MTMICCLYIKILKLDKLLREEELVFVLNYTNSSIFHFMIIISSRKGETTGEKHHLDLDCNIGKVFLHQPK